MKVKSLKEYDCVYYTGINQDEVIELLRSIGINAIIEESIIRWHHVCCSYRMYPNRYLIIKNSTIMEIKTPEVFNVEYQI